MAEAPDRAVIYRRVSSADQVDGTSLDTQRLDCLRLVEREGLALAQEWDFVDEGRSGASTDRPGLNALRQAASRAQFEVVVVAKADRLSRNHLDHLTLVRFFETLGIRLITTEGDLIGRTPEQRLQRNILGVIAEFEREQILRRTRQGLRATALDGGWPGGRAPFGFSLDRSTRTGHTRLIVNDEEAAVLRRACELIVDEGLSTVQAAERLNDLGLRPRNASRWTYVNLRKTLRLSALSGTWTYRLSPTQDRPDGEAIDLAVPSLISRERHLRLLEILAKKSTVVKADRRGKQYLLGRGRMTSPCGRNFHGRAQSDRPAVYACANVGPDATGDCECYRIPADQIEEWVWRKVQQIVAQPDQLAALAAEHLRQTETATSSPQDLVGITTEIARKERVLTDTAVRYLEEGVPADVLKTATAKIQADLTDLRRRRDLIETAAAEEADRSARLHSVSMVAKHMASRLPDLPHDQRRTVMDLLGLHVSVLGWEMCGTCDGKKKTSGGRGGQRCVDCGAIGMVPLLVVEGALSSALYLDRPSAHDVWADDEPSLGGP